MSLRRVFLLAIFVLTACEQGRYRDESIQVCVKDKEGVGYLVTSLQETARKFDLAYCDESVRVDGELEALDALDGQPKPIVHLHSHDKSEGIEISVTNLSLGAFDMLISYDLRSKRQIEAATDFRERIERRFEVRALPQGSGAFPQADCPPSFPYADQDWKVN